MRLPFISRRRHEEAIDFLAALHRSNLAHVASKLGDERDARRKAEAELAAEREPRPPVEVEHTELWSLIDWTLWGSGMGDVFREQLADQFIAALTPEQHAQALELIRWWTEDRGREPLGRRRYEDQQRRLHRAVRAVAAERAQAEGYRRTIRRLTDQLLDATGYQGEPLLPAARRALGIDDIKEES
ncbi:hypothetical protein [Streptomyces sp. CC208A]|uniref:hypothetical protein n=1 Tax=Streptomyces sp. CC208A TaxID=3044573 RepID=UPI0024A8045B|nr:hypothetical protein [Streptomyces sp. CC208A]